MKYVYMKKKTNRYYFGSCSAADFPYVGYKRSCIANTKRKSKIKRWLVIFVKKLYVYLHHFKRIHFIFAHYFATCCWIYSTWANTFLFAQLINLSYRVYRIQNKELKSMQWTHSSFRESFTLSSCGNRRYSTYFIVCFHSVVWMFIRFFSFLKVGSCRLTVLIRMYHSLSSIPSIG